MPHKPVYDPLIQALSGLTTVQAGSDRERPRLVRTILPDKLTGIVAAQAIAAALLRPREAPARASAIELSMLDSVIAFLWGSDMGSQTLIDDEVPQQEAAELHRPDLRDRRRLHLASRCSRTRNGRRCAMRSTSPNGSRTRASGPRRCARTTSTTACT